MDETEVKDIIKIAIEDAADNALHYLQERLDIKTGDYSPDVAIDLQEHLDALVKDYCDILNSQLVSNYVSVADAFAAEIAKNLGL